MVLKVNKINRKYFSTRGKLLSKNKIVKYRTKKIKNKNNPQKINNNLGLLNFISQLDICKGSKTLVWTTKQYISGPISHKLISSKALYKKKNLHLNSMEKIKTILSYKICFISKKMLW